jgi:hypothetical protein
MKYRIYQICLSTADAALINDKGWCGSELAHSYAKVTMLMSDEAMEKVEEHISTLCDLGKYAHVADIEAETLDDVFHIGNIGNCDHCNITKHAPMSVPPQNVVFVVP